MWRFDDRSGCAPILAPGRRRRRRRRRLSAQLVSRQRAQAPVTRNQIGITASEELAFGTPHEVAAEHEAQHVGGAHDSPKFVDGEGRNGVAKPPTRQQDFHPASVPAIRKKHGTVAQAT